MGNGFLIGVNCAVNEIYTKKIKWVCLHFLIGLTILSAVGIFIYTQWFYAGRHYLTDLFGLASIIVLIDLVLGPILGFWLLSPNKSKKENMTNLALIASLQLISLGYGVKQIDTQRLAYIVKWQASYFAVSKSDSRSEQVLERFYVFKEPEVGSQKRVLYDDLINQSISPVEMKEFFVLSDFEAECKTICSVITKNGIVNITKKNGQLIFNKSLH